MEMLGVKPAQAAFDPFVELSGAGRILVFASDDVFITRLKRLRAAGADVDDCESGMRHLVPPRAQLLEDGGDEEAEDDRRCASQEHRTDVAHRNLAYSASNTPAPACNATETN